MTPIASAGRFMSDLVMPPVCLACHDPLDSHDRLCPTCWSDIDFVRAPVCDRLGLPMPFDTGETMISAAAAAKEPVYNRARAVAQYSGNMRKLIHAYKYNDHQDARELFVNWLSVAGRDLLPDADLILPVPLHRWRLLMRRFNQSALLARNLARRHGLSYEPNILRRIRRTRPQVGLNQAQRRDNLSGAFQVTRSGQKRIKGRAVLLIDDVITTGATADACARALKKAGASRIDILSLAIVTDRARMTT